jgi:hypothetical protein
MESVRHLQRSSSLFVVRLDPNDRRVLERLGGPYQSNRQARAALRQAVAMYPDAALAVREVWWFLVEPSLDVLLQEAPPI